MPTADNSHSRLVQRRREMALANFHIYNPTQPIQTPSVGGVTPVSVYVTSHNGILPWVVDTPGGVVSQPNPVAVAAAAPAAPATAATVPGPPTLVSATGGNASIALVWTAGSDGGSAITGYQYTTDTGSTKTYKALVTSTGTTATITTLSSSSATLVNGTTYTISIVAVNAVGAGTASGSLSATPTPPPMVITIDLDSDRAILLNMALLGGQSVTIDWGDNTTNTYNGPLARIGPRNYTASTGQYTLTITGTANVFTASAGGANGGVQSGTGGVTKPIVSLSRFLDSLTNLSGVFSRQFLNFTVPTTLPPNVTNLSNMFRFSPLFNQPLNSWETAAVTTMASMFSGATAFYQDISSWNVSSLTAAGAQSIFLNCPLMIANPAYWPNFASNSNLPNPATNPTYYTT